MFLRNPRLWRYSFAAFAWSVLLYVALVVGAFFVLVPMGESHFGGSRVEAHAFTVIIFAALVVLLSGTIFLAFVSFLGSLLWDKLSAEVEEMVLGVARESRLRVADVLRDGLARALLAVALGLIGIGIGFCIPVVGSMLMAALVGLLEFTAPAFIRRGKLLRTQLRELRTLRGCVGFALCAGVLALVPLLNILLVPIMIAAGTIMVARSGVTAA